MVDAPDFSQGMSKLEGMMAQFLEKQELLMKEQFQQLNKTMDSRISNDMNLFDDPHVNESLRKEVEAIKESFRRMNIKENSMDMEMLSFDATLQLPTRFEMPILEKFDGTGCPVVHINIYFISMKAKGANEEITAQFFPLTLVDAARLWYFRQDHTRMKNWSYLCQEFVKQYEHNKAVEVTRRDLEITKQQITETIHEFVARWRKKASQLVQRIPEKEQVQIVMKNLVPTLYQHVFSTPLFTFEMLLAAGDQIEDAISSGRIKGHEEDSDKGISFDYNHKPTEGDITQDVYAVNAEPPKKKREWRKFDNLGVPLSTMFEKLKLKDLLTPLQPVPLPNPLPRRWNPSRYCAYHQGQGHDTDYCIVLHHKIQDLIDSGTISKDF